MTYFPKTEITFPAGGAEVDPFGRLRVSGNHLLLSSQLNYDLLPLIWDQYLIGEGGSSVVHLPDESSALLTAGGSAGDLVVRQTRRYWLYRAGQGQGIALTFAGMSQEESAVKRVGYFDGADGIFLEATGSDIAIVRRSSTSGTPVDTRISQEDWNKDKLDGTGPSAQTLDIAKAQILVIDLQWLGVGRVRVGFDIGGKRTYVHVFEHANIETEVYMRTGSLPIRYEVERIESSENNATLKQICSSVVREGGLEEEGQVACASNGATAITATTTAQAVLHLRLRSTHIRAFLRALAVALTNVGNVEIYWRAILNGTLSSAPVFAGHSPAAELSTTVRTYTEGTGTVLGCGHVPAQGAAKTTLTETLARESMLGVAANIAGVSDILSIVVQTPSTTSNFYTAVTYLELY